jgi:hypothetical protein
MGAKYLSLTDNHHPGWFSTTKAMEEYSLSFPYPLGTQRAGARKDTCAKSR